MTAKPKASAKTEQPKKKATKLEAIRVKGIERVKFVDRLKHAGEHLKSAWSDIARAAYIVTHEEHCIVVEVDEKKLKEDFEAMMSKMRKASKPKKGVKNEKTRQSKTA